jgi:hypothetical protein
MLPHALGNSNAAVFDARSRAFRPPDQPASLSLISLIRSSLQKKKPKKVPRQQPCGPDQGRIDVESPNQNGEERCNLEEDDVSGHHENANS